MWNLLNHHNQAVVRSFGCISLSRTLVLGSLFDSQPEQIDYSQYEYKLIMSLGLMSMDIPKIQSRVGDKGGIKFVIGIPFVSSSGQPHHPSSPFQMQWRVIKMM
jgi:hypothetical protein